MDPWIISHINDDPARLRLKYGAEHARDILQIECRRKYAAKLGPVLEQLPDFEFPTALSGEQSTSWPLAQWHASLVRKPDATVVDLTAGLGIDAYAMACRGCRVTAVERDPEVAAALSRNYAGVAGFEAVCADCREYVRTCGRHFDVIFIDPARRDAAGRRVFALDGCEPDVTAMLPDLRRICDTLIVKASPMLDVAHTLRLMPDAHQVIALGTTTECKELDVVCRFDVPAPEQPLIRAVTVNAGGVVSDFAFTRADEAAAEPRYGVPRPGDYVYDPYPAVMKAGALKLPGCLNGLSKLHANTHLWFGPQELTDFPGHRFRVVEVLPYASKHIKRYAAAHPRVNVTARNFDVVADALRRKLGVTDASDQRLFAVTGPDGAKYLITCENV